ncbi:MAG TPA: biotin synthase BioB [Burkholderiales bacterium]|jgi:biotin synthase|nr:biotin synthase BioB [Burkholderiales bacterium]
MDVKDVLGLFRLPFTELVFRAAAVHRAHFDPSQIQLSSLLSVKTGGCPEDCAYCPQSRRYATGVRDEDMLPLEQVVESARVAKAKGASRFCMGAAWRTPKDRDLEKIEQFIRAVKQLGLETCVTLGMLKPGQAERLRDAGLDYYNHNLDTSPQFYGEIISTRTYQDRLDTLERVRAAGIRVCCGGIVGMGESREDRAALIAQLSSLDPHPESVPINSLIRVKGTPLHGADPVDPLEFVRTIAAARICMPKAWVRLSAGRETMPEALQALCFLAGANSVFYGEKLLTTPNPEIDTDRALFERLGLTPTA